MTKCMKKIVFHFVLFFNLAGFSQEQVMLDIRLQLDNSYMGNAFLKITDSSNQVLYNSNGLKIENYGVIFNLSQSSFPLTIVWMPGGLNLNGNNSCLFDCVFTFTYSYTEYITGKTFNGFFNPFFEPKPYFAIYSPYINQLTAETSTIGICSFVNILHGYPHYYSIDNINWNIVTNNIPFSFATFVPYDLLGQNFRGDLRIKSKIKTSYASPTLTIMSKIITYNVIGCSPDLQFDPPLVSNPSCNNTLTGTINLKFQSPIKNDEQLLLNLFTNASPPKFLDSKFVAKSSIINDEYTWHNRGAGNYFIKYQAQKTTDNTEDVNSSAIQTKPFSIVNPPLFSFSAIETQPKCYGEKGTITVTASGGTPPYYYCLNDDPKIEFTSPKTIDVDARNNYLKVVDDKDCFDNTKNETKS